MSVNAGAATAETTLPPIPDTVVVETRFGCYEFTQDNRVHMPKGPLGFQDHHDFALANLPDPKLESFKLMQSLEDRDLCFIVTALPEDGSPFEAEDLEEICAAAGVPRRDAIFLLIVTIRPAPEGEGIVMTANLRAPIVFNPHNRLARQCVTANPTYPLQQPFGVPPEAS